MQCIGIWALASTHSSSSSATARLTQQPHSPLIQLSLSSKWSKDRPTNSRFVPKTGKAGARSATSMQSLPPACLPNQQRPPSPTTLDFHLFASHGRCRPRTAAQSLHTRSRFGLQILQCTPRQPTAMAQQQQLSPQGTVTFRWRRWSALRSRFRKATRLSSQSAPRMLSAGVHWNPCQMWELQ